MSKRWSKTCGNFISSLADDKTLHSAACIKQAVLFWGIGVRQLLKDSSGSAWLAGAIAVLVGFTSSVVVVFQAAQALGANAAQTASWIWALGVGMALTSIGLAWRYRMPIITAWSTPAAALLISSGQAGVSLSDAVGAFIIAGALIALVGFLGAFERLMRHVPASLAAALLAGVLLRFVLQVWTAMQAAWLLVLAMFVAYVAGRRYATRYAVLWTLAAGVIVAALQGQLHVASVAWQMATPVWVTPTWSWSTVMSVAIPMFVVTMASQNLPGVAALHTFGYRPPLSKVIGTTGVATVALAPFGAFSINLAAITAAICMSQDAHPQHHRRYIAAISAGLVYLLVGILGATVTALLHAFPVALIQAIAGLALLGTVSQGLVSALADGADREAAMITFVVTASGMTLWGIGSAFWGLVLGLLTWHVLRRV